MRIVSEFEGGNVQVVSATDPQRIEVTIPPDRKNERFRQWFSFVLEDAPRAPCKLAVTNASACTWARAFKHYRVCASYDGERWFRVPTEYDGTALRFELTPAAPRVHFAYFAPYPSARLFGLIERAVAAGARRSVLATTALGTEVPLVTLGRADRDAPNLWIVAQQHPGEPQAGWFVEGLLERLLRRDDRLVTTLLSRASFSIVPRINPDGVALGNHRTNAAGLDLNRQWLEPAAEAPEVAGVRAAMQRRGVDFFLDVHGDEVLPYVFVQGTDGIPRRSARLAALEERFARLMIDANEDFQTEHSYPRDMPGEANLRIAANWAGDTFDCLSLTLEMPFIDNDFAPDEAVGWSPERCKQLGSDVVATLGEMVSELRAPPVTAALGTPPAEVKRAAAPAARKAPSRKKSAARA